MRGFFVGALSRFSLPTQLGRRVRSCGFWPARKRRAFAWREDAEVSSRKHPCSLSPGAPSIL